MRERHQVSQPSMWGTHSLSDGSIRLAALDARLELASRDGEVWWRAGSGEFSDEADEPSWTRWVSGTWQDEVRIVPCLPDRPVVVEPEVPFQIAPQGRADVFVLIPLWARLQSGRGDHVIAEVPLEPPPDTWWGDPTLGELAYAITTRARRVASIEDDEADYAICRLELINESTETLPVDQFAVRCPQLSLFQAESRFWTNAMRATFNAEVEGSQIEILRDPPPEAIGAKPVSPRRAPVPGRWRALTFSRLVGPRTGP